MAAKLKEVQRELHLAHLHVRKLRDLREKLLDDHIRYELAIDVMRETIKQQAAEIERLKEARDNGDA